MVATSHLVMVAVDDNGKPRPVPPLPPETDDDHRASATRRSAASTGSPCATPSRVRLRRDRRDGHPVSEDSHEVLRDLHALVREIARSIP